MFRRSFLIKAAAAVGAAVMGRFPIATRSVSEGWPSNPGVLGARTRAELLAANETERLAAARGLKPPARETVILGGKKKTVLVFENDVGFTDLGWLPIDWAANGRSLKTAIPHVS